MSSFRNQIDEDIKFYQEKYKYIENIHKPEWAFNYWVLDKLFFEEEELIEQRIVDYNDMGIDAYEIYEDTKEVYLIQNKYFSDSTRIATEYIKNDFLIRGITALENGTYKRSEELQEFFNKYKDDSEFVVYLQLFVTNNAKNTNAEEYIREFNLKHPHYRAQIFYLDDIKERYFEEPFELKQKLSVRIESVVKGTILNINTEAYKMENIIDARYVLTPVASIYKLYRTAKEKNYPIFDKNIREYLGRRGGINKKIYETLLDREERKNFFYYNNGITVICDKMSKIKIQSSKYNMNAYFEISNPQIVNGCQTVNSIFEALKNVNPEYLEKEYKDSFVMLKVLEIDRENDKQSTLYTNIVKYNNSQNSIDEKTFVANRKIFYTLQRAFEDKGLLLWLCHNKWLIFDEK